MNLLSGDISVAGYTFSLSQKLVLFFSLYHGCSGFSGPAEQSVRRMGEGTQQWFLQCDEHSTQVYTVVCVCMVCERGAGSFP